MKKFYRIILIIFSLSIISCEDVVELDLDTAEEKLVIDAILNFDELNPNENQVIKLSKTNAFYSQNTNPQLNAEVWIEDNLNIRYDFIDSLNNGNYTNNQIQIDLNKTFTLFVRVDAEIYKATTKFYSTPEIDEITQINDAGFSGEDYEFNVWYQDRINEENFYFFSDNIQGYKEYKLSSDVFSNGNRMNVLLLEDELETGDSFEITFTEISKEFYNYMNRILSISQNSGNPFASPTGVIRGNIINSINSDNYPLGYFSLNNLKKEQIIVQ